MEALRGNTPACGKSLAHSVVGEGNAAAGSKGSLLEAQLRVVESIVRGQPLSEVLEALCLIAEQHAATALRAAILLADDHGQLVSIAAAPSLPAVCGAVVHDAAAAALQELASSMGLKAAWSMPIASSSGRAIGSFATYLMDERELSSEDRQLLALLAQTAALAIERTRSEAAPQTVVEAPDCVHRARLDYAVELSGVGFWYCDLPFDELTWDDRVKAHFFLPPDARVTIDDFFAMLHPEDRESTRQAIERSIETKQPYDVVYRTVCSRTQDEKWIRALGGTAYDAAGQPRRFDGVTLDVTAQRRVQERLAALLEREQEEGRERALLVAQLREQERRKDEFLATLAHELRNPLAALRFGLELFDHNHGPELSERARATMERQLSHLVRMVDDLLDTSRITLGKLTLQNERFDFRVVLQSAVEAVRPLIEANSHELLVQLPEETLTIDGDPTRLSQVLANLLNNAAKYTPSGGRIEVRVSTCERQLHVTVSDNGAGIPDDMLEKIFDVFTQIERSVKQARGGLGLGLTLVRRLAELHGGKVTAASGGVGRGSTFTLQLPLAAAQLATLAAQRSAAAAEQRDQRLRVLIVDDNEDAAECLASLLELKGHRAHLAHTGPDAVTSALALCPDVILLDIGLPGFDGWEVARRLRQELNERVPRLVAITGFGAEDDRRRSRQAGFDAHLIKPISSSLLLKELAAVKAHA